jgi:hypothetical protein
MYYILPTLVLCSAILYSTYHRIIVFLWRHLKIEEILHWIENEECVMYSKKVKMIPF